MRFHWLHLLVPALLCAACGQKEGPAQEPGAGYTILGLSADQFRIVYHEEEDDGLAREVAYQVQSYVKKCADVTLPISPESAWNKSGHAILIGQTSAAWLAGDHDTFDYSVHATDGNLVVIGASGWSMKKAADLLAAEYFAIGKEIPSDVSIKGNCRGRIIFERAEGTNLRILDDNIWAYNKNSIPDAWKALGADPRNSARAPQFAALVQALHPDVFCFQEYESPMDKIFLPLVNSRYAKVLPSPVPSVWNCTPIFYNKDMVEPVLVHYRGYDAPWNNSNSKSYTAAVFRHVLTNVHFIIVNTHLWWKSESAAAGSDNARADQARLIAAEVESLLAQYPAAPVFVMGDMNCRLTSAAMKVLTEKGYQDCGLTATDVRQNFTGHHACSETGFSFTPQENDNCATSIDHIFEYNCAGRATVRTHKIVTAAFTLCLTDHCPRYIDVALAEGK